MACRADIYIYIYIYIYVHTHTLREREKKKNNNNNMNSNSSNNNSSLSCAAFDRGEKRGVAMPWPSLRSLKDFDWDLAERVGAGSQRPGS